MKPGKRGLDAIAPPPRPRAGAAPAATFSAPADSAKAQFNVRIAQEKAVYARVLAAKTGRQLNEVVEEAIALLADKYGDA